MTKQEEIENFFTSVEKVVFSEPESKNDHLKGVPLIWLLLEETKFNTYRKNGKLQKIITDFVHNGKLLFEILQTANQTFQISLVRKDSEEQIFLDNAEIDQSINDFIRLTNKNDKIFLLIGSSQNDEILPEAEKFKNLLLILDGYSVLQV
jgi:hypothetical protein